MAAVAGIIFPAVSPSLSLLLPASQHKSHAWHGRLNSYCSVLQSCKAMLNPTHSTSRLIGFLQVATKAGVFNVPEWYEAGSVWVKNNPGFPFGMLPHDQHHRKGRPDCHTEHCSCHQLVP